MEQWAGLGRWFWGVVVLPLAGDFHSGEEAPLGNHCAQSSVSACLASPGYAMGHCKIKFSLYRGQQIWWTLRWVLGQGWAGGFGGLRFCRLLEIFIQVRRYPSATTAHRALPMCV